jgi:hypothetical protein
VRDFAALPSWWTDLKSVELLPPRNGGRVRITERGFVKNVIFRFVARFVFGYTSTMEGYLRDLAKKFSEPTPQFPK